MKRWVLNLLMIAALVTPNLAWAQVGGNSGEIDTLNKEISARKDTIKKLEETMASYQSSIAKKKLEATSLKNQVSILDNRIAKTDVDIALTREKIKSAQLEIEALELSIRDKEAAMSKQKTIIATIVRDVHAQDQKNYLEIMLTNDNFSDFYNQVKYLENVYTDLGRNVKNLRLIKEDLDNKQQQIKARQVNLQNLNLDLENKRNDLTEQTTYKRTLLVDTQQSEKKYSVLMESIRKQYQAIESEVRDYEAQVKKRLASQDKIESTGDAELDWPVTGRYITATFHDPDYSFGIHDAIDIRMPQGSPVRAAASGYIAKVRRCSTASCFAYVLIVHTGELSTLYGHLSGFTVSDDQFVNKGDIIGYSGGTPGTIGAGQTTGPHLHFSVRLRGAAVDPLSYLLR